MNLPRRCALCLQDRPLCDSHILPEFLYSLLYDEKHRFYAYSIPQKGTPEHHQKGLREPLLCLDCEQRFSKLEDYAKRVLDGGIEIEISPIPGGYCAVVDYAKFKLFALSLLWRAGVSTRREFPQVSLGPHQGILREMLLANDPGPFWKYGFLLNYPPDQQAMETFKAAIIQPETIRVGAHRGHRFILGVSTWVFFASSHMRGLDIRLFSLFEDGRLLFRSGGKHLTNLLVKIAGNFSQDRAHA